MTSSRSAWETDVDREVLAEILMGVGGGGGGGTVKNLAPNN